MERERSDSSRGTWLRGAAVLLLFGTALTLGPARADEQPRKRDLLVKCRTEDVDRVLQALRGLDVLVYDLDAMERMSVPASAASLAQLPDARALHARLLAAVARVQAELPEPGVVQVSRLTVKERRATLRIRTDAPATADRLRDAIQTDAAIAARLSVGRGVELGGAKEEDGAWQTDIHLRLEPPSAPASEADLLESGHEATRPWTLDPHLAAVGARLVLATGERRTLRSDGRVAVLSRTYRLAPTTADVLHALLERLAREQGVVVTEIEWARGSSGEAGEGLLQPAFELSRRVRQEPK